MLLGREAVAVERVAVADLRELVRRVAGVGPVVHIFHVDGAEAGERQDGPRRSEAVHGPGALTGCRDVHAGRVEEGVVHLACDHALPDEVVETGLLRVEILPDRLWCPADGCGPYRLVGLLGALDLAGVEPWRLGRVGLAVGLLHETGGLMQSRGGDVRGVCPHVGDETGRPLVAHGQSLVELLCDLHRPAGGEPQLTRGLLLKRAGDERSRGTAMRLPPAHGVDPVVGARQVGGELLCPASVVDLDLALLPFDRMELRGETALRLGRRALRQGGLYRPVLFGNEDVDLLLAVHDEAQGDRLHPSGREAAPDLTP